jgi:hypothetical protein
VIHVLRRTLTGVSLAILGAAAMAMLMSSVSAQPEPTPGPSQPVRERNLDVNGLIRVHEQGTANVNVANSQLTVSGTVSVDNFPTSINVGNFPQVQDVNVTGGAVKAEPSPATLGFSHDVCAEPDQVVTVTLSSVINATDLTINASLDTEFAIYFKSPIPTSGSGLPGIGQAVFSHQNFDGEDFSMHHAFTRPVPINAVVMHCTNESSLCCSFVNIVGTPGS